jgi:hypothetical protein
MRAHLWFVLVSVVLVGPAVEGAPPEPNIDETRVDITANTRVAVHVYTQDADLSAEDERLALDVASRVQYFYPADGRVYSISSSEDIREITHPGTPAEGSRPAGHDSGYLWRAATFNSLLAVDGGVFAETETLGLSRSFPPMLGWFIEPIAKRLGRESVRKSLQEFSAAVKARAKARQH